MQKPVELYVWFRDKVEEAQKERFGGKGVMEVHFRPVTAVWEKRIDMDKNLTAFVTKFRKPLRIIISTTPAVAQALHQGTECDVGV